MAIDKELQVVDISDSMRGAYLEYAMSVIIGRALPDVRDGLKPVHRRILYAMQEINLAHNRPYAKSARVVGDVIGKYHPHGDVAIYDTLVRLAQDFSMRYQLIDGQGNFGSIDGDAAAAMRYTEVKLKKLTSFLLSDIDKNTVDFQPNYDNTQTEPVVLPSRIPSLLMNGSSGIAVGMATNIPPHNLSELINGIIYMIDNPDDRSIDQLMKHIPAPDFPTGGTILNKKGIFDAYTTGRGKIKVRGETSFEEVGKHQAIIISELPYGVNKAKLVMKIAELVNEKKLTEINDISDQSDRRGMRVVIELKKGTIADSVLHKLYKLTSLQTTYGINMLAVVNKQPQVMNLQTILQHFIDHRQDVVTRRTRFELKKTEERAHVVEGLLTAIQNIDEIVSLIKQASDSNAARKELIARFLFTEVQANAILDMRLHRLTGLEHQKLNDELKNLEEKIRYLRSILDDSNILIGIIKDELLEIKKEFSDARRTKVIDEEGNFDIESVISPELYVVTLSKEGYIKRTKIGEFRAQNRGGKGKIGMSTKEDDIVEQVLIASALDDLMLFSDKGKIFWKKVYQLPESSRSTKGRALVNFIGLDENEKIVSWLNCSKQQQQNIDQLFLIMITAKGVIKKTAFGEYLTKRVMGTKSIQLDDDDSVVKVQLSFNDEYIFIATRGGMANMFEAASVRAQGRVTRGSRGVTLKKDEDRVVSLELVKPEDNIITISERGFGKRSKVSNYRKGSRGNIGVINMRITSKGGRIVGSRLCSDKDQLLIISKQGILIRLEASQIPIIGRHTQGVKVINLEDSDQVSAISIIDYQELETIRQQQSSGRLNPLEEDDDSVDDEDTVN